MEVDDSPTMDRDKPATSIHKHINMVLSKEMKNQHLMRFRVVHHVGRSKETRCPGIVSNPSQYMPTNVSHENCLKKKISLIIKEQDKAS